MFVDDALATAMHALQSMVSTMLQAMPGGLEVSLLPYIKQNIVNQLQFTVVGDDYTVLKTDATVGFPEYFIDLYN